MIKITKETWRKNGVQVIVVNGIKWLNETNIEKQLGHSRLRNITSKYPSKCRKQRQELVNCGTY